jgi:hypothetical protein
MPGYFRRPAAAAMAASVVSLERYYGDDHSLLPLVTEVVLGMAVYGASSWFSRA